MIEVKSFDNLQDKSSFLVNEIVYHKLRDFFELMIRMNENLRIDFSSLIINGQF